MCATRCQSAECTVQKEDLRTVSAVQMLVLLLYGLSSFSERNALTQWSHSVLCKMYYVTTTLLKYIFINIKLQIVIKIKI
jgi:hypothetical protein